MHTPAFLTEIVVVFAVAVVVVLALSRLRLPTIAGYILAGALLGPSGLRVVQDTRQTESLAEVGVVLLLFTIGLEFSLARLRRLWRVLALGGGLQVGLTVGAVAGLAAAGGARLPLGIYLGFLVALSSTAIVLRALTERREVDAPHGRLIVGALVFQDLCIVPMMLVTPMLAGQGGSIGAIGLALGKAALLVIGTVVLGRLLIPRLLALVAASRQRDLFLLAVLLLCTGIAWLTSLVGLSVALGAFLAGIALADSEYGHHALSEVLPFREALASLFFISVGMLFDVRIVLARPLAVLGLVGAVLLGKALIAAAAGLAMRFPLRVAVLAGIGLAQIGEFSFVLANVGASLGLLSREDQRLFVAMSVITMVVTPLVARLAPHLAAGASRLRRLEQLLGARAVDDAGPEREALAGHVVIAGYGVAGRLLREALHATSVPHLIIELRAESVRVAQERGERAFYGDVTSPEVLAHAAIERARALVVLINDPDAARRTVSAARRLVPDLTILVRVQYLAEVEPLRALGATDVIAEEFETGSEILARVLREAEVPHNVIRERIRHARAAGAGIERPVTVPRRMLGEIHALSELKVGTFAVRERDHVPGTTVAAVHRTVAGRAAVVAIGRAGVTIPSPGPDEPLLPGDVLYFVGERSALSVALPAREGAGPE